MDSPLLPLDVTIEGLQNASNVDVSNNGTAVVADAGTDLDIAVQSFDTGDIRVNSVLNSPNAPTTQSYTLDLPESARLQPLPDNSGYLVVVKDDTPAPSEDTDPEDTDPEDTDPEGTEDYEEGETEEVAATPGLADNEVAAYRIDAPWAVDATGKLLPTSITAAGNELTQSVDTSNAAFPVVAVQAAAAAGPSLTLLSFNMCGNKCGTGLRVAKALVSSIQNRSPQPAVVMMQEVCRSQYNHLTKALTGYRGRFVKTVGGACAYDHSDYGIAILMRTTKTPTFLGGWPLPGGSEARRVMCLKSSSFRGSKPLVACNTHITTNASDRPGQVKFVVKKAKSYNAGNRVVVGGDFNAYPYSDDMDVMYNGAYSPSGTGPFAEADLPYRGDRNSGYEGSAYNEYTSCGDQDPVCDGTFGDHANRKIDYIFLANGDWANYGADATKSTSSDHMLLWAWANIV